MTRHFSVRTIASKMRAATLGIGVLSGVAALLLSSAAAHAETSGALPRAANGKPDFSGLWQTLSTADWDLEPHNARKDAPAGLGVVVGGEIPYQPWAVEKRKENFEKREVLDPRNKCFLPGVPRANYSPFPFQIFQTDTHLTLLYGRFYQPDIFAEIGDTKRPCLAFG